MSDDYMYFTCDICRERYAATDESEATARSDEVVYYVCRQCFNNGAFNEFIAGAPPTRRAVWRNGRFKFEPMDPNATSDPTTNASAADEAQPGG